MRDGQPAEASIGNGSIFSSHERGEFDRPGNFHKFIDAVVMRRYEQEPRNISEYAHHKSLESPTGVMMEAAFMRLADLEPELFDLLMRQVWEREDAYRVAQDDRDQADSTQYVARDAAAEAERLARQDTQLAIQTTANLAALGRIEEIIEAYGLPISIEDFCK